jgi:spoIIIJ-associated protein
MERIKKIIRETLQVMSLKDIEIDMKKDSSLKDREVLNVNIKIDAKEADYFLKEDGIGLSALQHLVRVLISRKNPNPALFVLDINDYRKEREEFLTELALKTVQEVRKTKRPVILRPMSAYERRLIHLKLAEQSDIVTESTGQEPERKVVVRLYP